MKEERVERACTRHFLFLVCLEHNSRIPTFLHASSSSTVKLPFQCNSCVFFWPIRASAVSSLRNGKFLREAGVKRTSVTAANEPSTRPLVTIWRNEYHGNIGERLDDQRNPLSSLDIFPFFHLSDQVLYFFSRWCFISVSFPPRWIAFPVVGCATLRRGDENRRQLANSMAASYLSPVIPSVHGLSDRRSSKLHFCDRKIPRSQVRKRPLWHFLSTSLQKVTECGATFERTDRASSWEPRELASIIHGDMKINKQYLLWYSIFLKNGDIVLYQTLSAVASSQADTVGGKDVVRS